jgi:hypothetical protein
MIEKYPPTGIEIAPMPDPLDSVVAEFLGIQNEKLAAHTERERREGLMREAQDGIWQSYYQKNVASRAELYNTATSFLGTMTPRIFSTHGGNTSGYTDRKGHEFVYAEWEFEQLRFSDSDQPDIRVRTVLEADLKADGDDAAELMQAWHYINTRQVTAKRLPSQLLGVAREGIIHRSFDIDALRKSAAQLVLSRSTAITSVMGMQMLGVGEEWMH